jgi:hypothetical protein
LFLLALFLLTRRQESRRIERAASGGARRCRPLFRPPSRSGERVARRWCTGHALSLVPGVESAVRPLLVRTRGARRARRGERETLLDAERERERE